MQTVKISLIAIVILLMSAVMLRAEPDPAMCNVRGKGMGWCRKPQGVDGEKRFGGCYGARQPVKSSEEARKHLEAYYADRKDLVIGKIKERRWGFEAEIFDQNNKAIDRVMVHRKTGRIRSMY